MIAVNPALSASPPELRGREVRPPDPDKLTSFFKTVEEDAPDLAMFAWLAAFTGARRGEVCALRWPDVDFVGHPLSAAFVLPHEGRVAPRSQEEPPIVVGERSSLLIGRGEGARRIRKRAEPQLLQELDLVGCKPADHTGNARVPACGDHAPYRRV
jgi:hypothetical protein